MIPAPSVLLLSAPSLSLIPPSMVVSCFRWSKPNKSITVLKTEQHRGELNRTLASWELKLLADRQIYTNAHTDIPKLGKHQQKLEVKEEEFSAHLMTEYVAII